MVGEDLSVTDKTDSTSEEFCNIKYSRLNRILHFNNFKNIIESQCKNKGVQLTLVPSHYTSQRCSCCGYVDSNNRKTQEDFVCLQCGNKSNADLNAAQNIKQYKDLDVLSSQFLKQNNNWFIPKLNNKFKIRNILDDYFEYS